MLKRLKIGTLLIVLGEILSLASVYFSSGDSAFSEFTTGVLLGLAVGMKLVGVLLLFVVIINFKHEKN